MWYKIYIKTSCQVSLNVMQELVHRKIQSRYTKEPRAGAESVPDLWFSEQNAA